MSKVTVVAVAERLPDWAEAACRMYLQRFPAALAPRVVTVPAGRDSADEAARLLKASSGMQRILLDERGDRPDSIGLAERVAAWRTEGADVALLIGGAAGHGAELRAQCPEALSLSALTLPHALARVVLIEQLYRAHTLLAGHPYHRG